MPRYSGMKKCDENLIQIFNVLFGFEEDGFKKWKMMNLKCSGMSDADMRRKRNQQKFVIDDMWLIF